MKFPIALQLFSVREDLEKDFEGTLKKVSELGYDGVEFAGLYGHAPAEIRALLEKYGLTALSAHVPYLEMMEDPEKVLGDYKEIGCIYVAIPYLTEEYRPGTELFLEVMENTKKLGEIANKLGLVLLYHNHDFEFEKIEGEYALDRLYREVSPELLQTEIDTCWVNVAGEVPADYLRKYSGRTPVVHLKDFMMSGKTKAESDDFEFRPVGFGKQDFPAILKAAEETGAKWVVVEQDAPSMGKTAFECAQASIEYLKGL